MDQVTAQKAAAFARNPALLQAELTDAQTSVKRLAEDGVKTAQKTAAQYRKAAEDTAASAVQLVTTTATRAKTILEAMLKSSLTDPTATEEI